MPGQKAKTTGATFPLTPVQRAYRMGSEDGQPLGGVTCHMYFEFDGPEPDTDRLEHAVRLVQLRHPLLRTAFPDAETAVVQDGPAVGLIHNSRPLETVREEMSQQRLAVEEGQTMDIRLSSLPGGGARLHLDIALIAADPPSIRTVLEDLADLYRRGVQALGSEDPDHRFVALRQQSATRGGADPDLAERVLGETVPKAPQPPLETDPSTVSGARFARHEVALSPDVWRGIQDRADREGAGDGDVLFAAFVHTLDRWSEHHDFLVNVPRFDRPVRPDLSGAVGDFSRLGAVRTHPADAGSLRDLVRAAGQALGARTQPTVQDVQERARLRHEPAPLLGAVYTALDAAWAPRRFTDCFGPLVWMISQTPQVWLDCLVHPHGDTVRMAWDAVDELFPAGVLEDMTEYCGEMLRALARNDWSSGVGLPLPAAQRRARERANDTAGPLHERLLHQRFFDLAASDPAPPALLGDGVELSRGDLARDALRVAALLRARGVGDGEPVGVCLSEGTDQVRAALGVLAAGGSYVPVGPEHPYERREGIFHTAGVRIVLADQAVAEEHETAVGPEADGSRTAGGGSPPATDTPGGPEVSCLPLALGRGTPPLDAPVSSTADLPAYLIFTSGSTGAPKGVEIAHRSAVNTVEDINDRWGVGPRDRCLSVSALDFDLSVYEIFGPLMAGGAVVMPSARDSRDPAAWLRLMNEHRVTVWDSVPVLLDMLITQAEDGPVPGHLRLVLTGGDWIGLDLPGRLQALVPGCRFVACGGATEGSVYSNWFEVGHVAPEWTSIPYGVPLRNQVYRVVDPFGRDCPALVPGEMWIGGAGVATCYRNDPERTADRFLEADGVRWYRTGDMGRYRNDGVLEFLGRLDQQVKLNGYRIELGDIESALAAHPDVARAVVVLAGEGTDRRIVACLQPAEAAMNTEEVAELAQRRLPHYAQPEDYLLLPELPLNSNGKIDRGKLASWAVPDRSPADEAPLHAGLEEQVAEEWEYVLGRSVTSRHDNFFDVGGNSLLGMRLAQALKRRFGIRIALRQLQSAATPAGMARVIDDAVSAEGGRIR
ncbi:non-ribosomal peptide synthetase [Streptomyces qinglanensis]|uniref:non-ribosomal peptide synthetase n=1 Tax=Streptomyces qinglanensis TaxID=943816 RepID=UPI003D73EE6B